MKKIVIFGGGTGLSCVLSGLKLFPIDVTAVIAVSDDGSSTGKLKEELDIPAVGDLGKVLLSMANVDDDFLEIQVQKIRITLQSSCQKHHTGSSYRSEGKPDGSHKVHERNT